MSILETPIEQSRQTSASPSTLEYRTALNAIQAGYCDERHNWVLNELLTSVAAVHPTQKSSTI